MNLAGDERSFECMRSAQQWLEEYGASHHNPINERLHWICVPVIVWCVLGLLWSVPFPTSLRTMLPGASWAGVLLLLAMIFYARLSVPLALGVLPFLAIMLWSISYLGTHAAAPLWSICAGAFVAAWIGQFVGHAIEKKRPSFFKDVQFLLIGPLWLVATMYRRLGINF